MLRLARMLLQTFILITGIPEATLASYCGYFELLPSDNRWTVSRTSDTPTTGHHNGVNIERRGRQLKGKRSVNYYAFKVQLFISLKHTRASTQTAFLNDKRSLISLCRKTFWLVQNNVEATLRSTGRGMERNRKIWNRCIFNCNVKPMFHMIRTRNQLSCTIEYLVASLTTAVRFSRVAFIVLAN